MTLLLPQHLLMLADSGITAEHAAIRGYRSIAYGDTDSLVGLNITKAGRSTPGLLVPQLRIDGSTWGYQYRPDTPRLRNGKPVKYETPVGQRNGIDVPPGVGPMLSDPAVPLWITEGVKKADCGALAGLPIVALPGVWSWMGRGEKGGNTAIADWRDIALDNRRVNLAFDGDVARKPAVRQALLALADYLKSKGAKVEYLHLPDTDDKTGLDDYLVENTVDELWRLVKPTPPPRSSSDADRKAASPPRRRLDDAHIAQHLADTALGHFRWCSALGWMRYSGTHWQRTTDTAVGEQVRQAVIALHTSEAKQGADSDRLRNISALFAANRIRAVVSLVKGIVEVDVDEFDRHPELLNVGNGVVDLENGRLRRHDPDLLLTRHTPVAYRVNATHPDWAAALVALPEEVTEWMQCRFGQAATGHPTPDDVLPALQGSGANGKSTVLAAIMRALGDYAVAVPERVLLANPSDHPTELMTLRGARMAVIEETPEARHLNVKRLKDVLGTETMTARYIAKDTVSWHPTHSLFLATNYRPRVDETDHGTWRRLALVRFPYTFRAPGTAHTGAHELRGDPTLRDRLKRGDDGRHEAVLAWVINGAVKWFANNRVIPPAPPAVAADTREWRGESDAILGFVDHHIVYDDDSHVLSTDLFAAFNDSLVSRGHKPWSDQTFAGRFAEHEAIAGRRIERRQTLATAPGQSRPLGTLGAVPKRYQAWRGIRFRSPSDEYDQTEESPAKPQDARGARGTPKVPHEEQLFETSDNPLHPLHNGGATRVRGAAAKSSEELPHQHIAPQDHLEKVILKPKPTDFASAAELSGKSGESSCYAAQDGLPPEEVFEEPAPAGRADWPSWHGAGPDPFHEYR